MNFSKMSVETITRDVRFIDSIKYFTDPNFFKEIRAVRLQRQVADGQCDYFLKFLKPLSQMYGFWLIYEIDDVIGKDDIPPYNIGRKAFQNDNFFNNIKNMLDASDLITVTTEKLKEYYVEKFEVNPDKFLVIPNYLPRWWIGETYNLSHQIKIYEDNIKKPRIGFPSSSSHFDLKNLNNGVDDFTHIVDFIRKTINKYTWVFIGGCPKQLEDLAQLRKIEVVPGSDLLNYPRELWRRNLSAIVAPLQDNIFNRCKSNIKLLEGWALGIPVIAQNLECYKPYTNMLFDNGDDLQTQLNNLLNDKQKYRKIIKENRRIVDYGDKNSPNGWWLEKNIMKYYEMYSIQQKTLCFDITKFNKDKDESVKLDLN